MGKKQPYKLLITKDQIESKVGEIADGIARDVGGEPTILVGLLKGSVVFLSDLMRALNERGVEPELDFMMASSYGESMEPSEHIEIKLDIKANVEGKTVLLVDDIVDTGGTLMEVMKRVEAKNPARILTCALLNKPSRRKFDVRLDYVGFDIEDVFVVGYGLDAAERHRSLPYIAAMEE